MLLHFDGGTKVGGWLSAITGADGEAVAADMLGMDGDLAVFSEEGDVAGLGECDDADVPAVNTIRWVTSTASRSKRASVASDFMVMLVLVA